MEEYKRLKGVIGKIGKTNLGKGGSDIQNLMRNPN